MVEAVEAVGTVRDERVGWEDNRCVRCNKSKRRKAKRKVWPRGGYLKFEKKRWSGRTSKDDRIICTLGYIR